MDREIRQARWERRGLGLALAGIWEARLHLSGSGLAPGQAALPIGAWAVLLCIPKTGPERPRGVPRGPAEQQGAGNHHQHHPDHPKVRKHGKSFSETA